MKTVAIIGHSNAHGLAGVNEMYVAYPHLLPRKTPFTDLTQLYFENIRVFTSAHGYATAAGVPPTHGISEGEWLAMTTNNPASPAAAHPHPSPYAYPNNVGVPWPNWRYDASLFDPSIDIGTGTLAGCEVPLMWRMSHYWGATVGLIKMAVPGSLFLRYDIGRDPATQFDPWSYQNSPAASRPESVVETTPGYYAWFTPADRFDWAISTDRLYASFIAKAVAAKAADSTMSIDRVVLWVGDNDCTGEAERVENWENDVRVWIRQLRADLVENELTDLPAHQIGIALMGVLEHYDFLVEGQHATMNAAYERIAADDPYVRYIDTSDYAVHDDDPGHLSYLGYIEAAQDIFQAFVDMDVDPYSAMDRDELITVSQLKDRVRLYHSRGKVQTDIADEPLLMHCNAALHHVSHQCGDMAWWLRRRTEITLDGGGTLSPITMPKQVHRVLDIESTNDATYKVHFEMVGHTDGGKVQIVLNDQTSGDYTVHYIRLPRDLTRDDELVPVPPMLLEWLVAEVCFRLSMAAANPLQNAAWKTELQRLQADVLKNLGATYRAKRDRLHSQRRLPDVLNRRRWRRWAPD